MNQEWMEYNKNEDFLKLAVAELNNKLEKVYLGGGETKSKVSIAKER